MLKKALLILFLFTGYAFAAEKAYAWGYGDLVAETLNVVKYMFSIGEFRDFWKVAMLISLISAVLMMLTPNPDLLKLPKIFILSMGIYTLFITAKVDVFIEDKADNNNSKLVRDVPWAVGKPFAFFSTLEYRLGATYETTTSIPNGMKYSNSGFMAPISIFTQATQHKIVSPSLYQNFNNYILECVMPDLENGYKDYRTLVDEDNIWAYLGNTSAAIFMLYINDSNETKLLDCMSVYANLNIALQNYTSIGGQGMEYLGKSIGMLSSSAIASKIGTANSYLLNSSKSASQMLLQNVAINSFSESFRNYASMNGVDVNNAAFHSTTASQAASAQMIVSGILGSKYIPIIKGVLTVIILGLTPILALMMVTPMGFKVLIGYLMILSWLTCWHFGDVLLNHIMTTKVQSALSSYGDIKISTIGLIDSTATDYINMAASMYWTIPTIAFLVVTGFSLSAFASLNNAMTTKLDRTSSAVGVEMGRGNMSFGNISHNNYNANKLDALASQVMGNSMRHDDIATSNQGTKSEKHNGVSNTYGQQLLNGGISADNLLNSLAKDMGKGYSLNGGNFPTKANDNGTSQVMGTSQITATSSDGREVSGTLRDGTILDKNGNILNGTMSINDNGKEIQMEYRDGKEVTRSFKDAQGNEAIVKNGNTFSITSGIDKGSYINGIIDRETGEKQITDGKVNGVDYNKTTSGSKTHSSSISNKDTSEATDLHSISMAHQEATSKDVSQSESLKNNVYGGVEFNSKDNLAGKVIGGVTGVSAKAGMNLSAEWDRSGKDTASTQDSKTDTINVSGSERKTNESSLSKNSSDEQKASVTKNQMIQELQNRANKGEELLNILNSMVMSKDKLDTGLSSSVGLGAKSEVENGSNYNGVHKQEKDTTESQYYMDENRAKDINRKLQAIKSVNLGEEIFNNENLSKEIKSGHVTKDSKILQKELDIINNVYDKAKKNLGSSGFVVNSAVQQVENVAMNISSAVKDVMDNFKGDGSLNKDGFEPKTKELKEATKTITPNQNRPNQQVEQVNDKK